MTHGPWRLIHHQDNDVVELQLDSEGTTESLWVTYEELATLKELIGAVKTSPALITQ